MRNVRVGIMRITVNGETRELPSTVTVGELVEQLSLKTSQVAIERNRQIVPRATYGQTNLSEGDEIEIVRFIGGG